ncbi:GNAT family N-acetyltransferase [Azospirillum thermophilum]|uniref:GNAT family N-acetyltransferase n=1 Tax=Azospirillum thermophilum TaxID=2202148 RepID=A0A2S2CLL6_9PROT|nr:GNAT family N-acetyltransferase [Azospirillum thermophilum]AWK85319.1 GNAT family N-acetyltransferase [Azospirillum thermophilum]
MSDLAYSIRRLSPGEAVTHIPALTGILLDCVEGGASVSFMAPLDPARAEAFWRQIATDVARGDRLLLVAAEEATGELLGTVQVVLAQTDNQPHRGDLCKMLVHRRARRRGVGEALMRAVEEEARAAGKTLLVLDTSTPEAERLYERAGWVRVGFIPDYALMPDGRPCGTTYFYKRIG